LWPCTAPLVRCPLGTMRDTNNRIMRTETDLTVRIQPIRSRNGSGRSCAARLAQSYSQNTGNEYPQRELYDLPADAGDLYDPHTCFTQPLNLYVWAHAIRVVQNHAVYASNTLKFSARSGTSASARVYEHKKASFRGWTATRPHFDTPSGPLLAATTNPLSIERAPFFRTGVLLVYKPLSRKSLMFPRQLKAAVQSTVNCICTNCMSSS